MDKIIKILETKTESFKATVIVLTREWAANNYETVSARKSFNEVQWCELLGITPAVSRFSNGKLGFPDNFYNSSDSRTFNRLQTEAYKISAMGKDAYIAKEEANANNHFATSLAKLAFRIQSKDLNFNNLDVQALHVNVNLEITISDGVKTVRAFTIIASGPVQRPHYRYLIK